MALQYTDEAGVRYAEKTVTIRRPAIALYQAWREFEQLPIFMSHVLSVTEIGTRSHWIVKTSAGPMEWDAELAVDIPERLIAWRSLPTAAGNHSGEVWFTPSRQGRATEVRVRIRYEPSSAASGSRVVTVAGENPAAQLDQDLYRFKHLMETGSLPTTRGQPRGGQQPERELRERADEPVSITQSAWERFAAGEVTP